MMLASSFSSQEENKRHGHYFYPSSLFYRKENSMESKRRIWNWYSNLESWYDVLQEACTYLSMWNILFPYFFKLDQSTLQYTRLVCSVGGVYMTWIYPKTIPVHYLHLQLEFPLTIFMDLLSHQYFLWITWGSPWTWEFRRHLNNNNNNVCLGCNHSLLYQAFWTRWIVLLYYVWFGVENTKERYNIRTNDIIKILVFSEIFFFFFH